MADCCMVLQVLFEIGDVVPTIARGALKQSLFHPARRQPEEIR